MIGGVLLMLAVMLSQAFLRTLAEVVAREPEFDEEPEADFERNLKSRPKFIQHLAGLIGVAYGPTMLTRHLAAEDKAHPPSRELESAFSRRSKRRTRPATPSRK